MFQKIMALISLWILPVFIIFILTMGLCKKVPIYEVFTDGAKDGFKVAVNIIPYLVAIIVAISMLRYIRRNPTCQRNTPPTSLSGSTRRSSRTPSSPASS